MSAWSPSDFTACSLVIDASVELNVTFWLSPSASILMDSLSTPFSVANASRTCFLQPAQVTPVMPTTYFVFAAVSLNAKPASSVTTARMDAMNFMDVCFFVGAVNRLAPDSSVRIRHLSSGNSTIPFESIGRAERRPVRAPKREKLSGCRPAHPRYGWIAS